MELVVFVDMLKIIVFVVKVENGVKILVILIRK